MLVYSNRSLKIENGIAVSCSPGSKMEAFRDADELGFISKRANDPDDHVRIRTQKLGEVLVPKLFVADRMGHRIFKEGS